MPNKKNCFRKSHLYISLVATVSMVFSFGSNVHSQVSSTGNLVPVITYVLDSEEQSDGSPSPSPAPNCASDEELAEINALIANRTSDPRVTGAVQIFNQSDVDALAGVIVATATFAFESTDGEDLDLSPLASMVEVRGNINMRSNTLRRYARFDCLKTITGNLVIENNNDLEVIDAFPLLESVGSNMQINNNTSLTSFPEFPSLTSTSFIQITGNSSLTSIISFPLLANVGFFQITQNNSLEIISGLNSLIRLNPNRSFLVNPPSAVVCNGQEGTLLCP